MSCCACCFLARFCCCCLFLVANGHQSLLLCFALYCIPDRINNPNGKCVFAKVPETGKEVNEGWIMYYRQIDVSDAQPSIQNENATDIAYYTAFAPSMLPRRPSRGSKEEPRARPGPDHR